MVAFDDLGRPDGQRDALGAFPDRDAPDPEAVRGARDRRERVLRAFHQLGERERLVMSLYVFEELTMSQIGEILGVSESRISQVRTEALRRLQPILEALFP
jgi:RNA polymerase sigma factor for flagellar operon FliA